MQDDVWANAAKGLLKSELKRRNMKYKDLADRLAPGGSASEMDERNLRNKIARGSFTAAFLLQCLTAIGCQAVKIDDLIPV
jgi:hypothetical protein